MASSASSKELEALHRLVASSLTKRIEEDMRDGIPTDAATLSSAIKFLKDNSITADPADADDLHDLRKKLTEQAQQRRNKGTNVVALATADLKAMEA
jgi:hypothetical protein